jgi:hypothetical protein
MGLNWLTNRWALDHAGDIEPAANNTYALGISNFWTRASIVTVYTYIVRLFGTTFTADLVANNSAAANQVFTLPAGANDTLLGWDTVQTVSHTRIKPRVIVAATASSLTPDMAVADLYAYTALATTLVIGAPINSVDGEGLDFRIRDNGTPQTLTLNAAFRALGVTIPSATTANKTLYIRTRYNAAESIYYVIDFKKQA